MTTIKYVGTQQRWPELPITGRPSAWMPGQQEERGEAEAAQLLGTGFFQRLPILERFTSARLVTDGNSLTALGGSPRNASLSPISDFGWTGFAMGFLGQRMLWVKNAAVSGANINQRIAAFAAEVMSASPTHVSFMEGRNAMVPLADSGGGLTLAEACDRVGVYVQQALSYGVQVFLWTHPTGTVKPASEPGTLVQWNLKLMAFNNFVRYLASTTRGVILVDGEAVTLDPLSATCSPKANFIRSGNDPHLTSRGNRAMGQAFAAAALGHTPATGGLYRATNNSANKIGAAGSASTRVLNSNALFQGSGGTATGGITGTIAAATAAGVAAGTATSVGSLVARADGYGNNQRIAVSAASAGCTVFCRADSAEAISYVNSGDYLYALANVSISGMASVLGVELGIYLQAGPTLSNFGQQISALVAADWDQTDLLDFWIATPISQFNLGAAVGLVYPRLNVNMVAGGAAQIDVGRMVLVNAGPQGVLLN